MQSHSREFCPALWLSGFFALGAAVHLVRFVLGVSLVVNGHDVPLGVSGIGGVLLAALSATCFVLSMKRPCEKSKGHGASGPCCTKK